MGKEEFIFQEYQQEISKLEEREAEIIRLEKKSAQLTSDTYQELYHLYGYDEETENILSQARVELSELEENFLLSLQQEKKKLIKQKEEVEQAYSKKMKIEEKDA